MAIQIERIRIKNFRALRDVEVVLNKLSLLVGTNNAGKTTFLRALNAVLGVSRTMLNKDDLFIDKDGECPENNIIIDIKIIPVDLEGNRVVHFEEQWAGKFGAGENIGTENDYEFFAFRSIYNFEGDDMPEAAYTLITDWTNQSFGPAGDFNRIQQVRNNIRMYYIDAQRDIEEDLRMRTSYFGKMAARIEDGYAPEDIENLSKLIKGINESAVDRSPVLTHLRQTLAKLNQTTQTRGTGVDITPFSRNIRDLHKGMKVDFQDNGSERFSMEYHGMGTRSWASILTAGAYIDWELQQIAQKIEEGKDISLLFPIIALEEPEAHLHPNAQRTLYSQMKSFLGQKIISTHSPYIAGQAGLEELRHFYKAEDTVEVLWLSDTLNSDEKRKLRREVILSKGELLFARAIILFEGETESQALPIFAEAFWTKQPFELGVSMLKVDGNNYRPYLILAQQMKIPWFILSDYDKVNIQRGVNNALEMVGYLNPDQTNYPNVIKLNVPIERYLIDEGYQTEIKKGVNAAYLDTTDVNTPQQQIIAGQSRVNAYSDQDLLNDISSDKGKVQYPTFWAKEIIQHPNELKRIPSRIRELFEAVDTQIFPSALPIVD
jgi:putative ATP-dependent endonuclease of the OLD family